MNYKKGIDSIENRKLRRTKLGEHRNQDRTRRISQRRRSGENNGLRGNTNANSIASSKSITNSNNISKIDHSKPRAEKKVYTGSAKDKLTQFYTDYNPANLLSIDSTLKKYVNKEDELFAKLAKMYSVDPSVFGPPSKSSFIFATTSSKDSNSGIGKKSSPTTTVTNGTPSKSFGSGTSAFAAYASPGMVSFGSLATPKKGSTLFGFGSFNKPSILGDNNKSTSKGRTTITSLRTLSDGFRALGDGDDDICDSDDMMECD